MLKADRVSEIFDEVEQELIAGCEKHGEKFANLHHGYAVLLEELDEVWDEVKKDNTAKPFKKPNRWQLWQLSLS